MKQPQPRRGQPLQSLATKILLFVFLSTFATALVVSAIAVHAAHDHVSAHTEREYAAHLKQATAHVRSWLERRGPDTGEPTPDEAAELAPALDESRPDESVHLLLVEPGGRVLAGASAPGETPPTRIPLGELRSSGAAEGAVSRRFWGAGRALLVGVARPVGAHGWYVVLEGRFEEAFAPVLAVVTQVFIVDLCIVLLLSYLAYRVTRVLVRPIETLSDAARRIAQGQFDHEIPEPSSHDELGLLSRTLNDMMRRLRGYQSEIEHTNRSLLERNTELKQAKETFEQLSITDGLTKLHNHRFFQDHLTREIKRVTRSGDALSMLLVDIDDFKALNDRFGHAAGDELLMGMARIMNEMVRDSDLLARYGGEEFVVLTADTDLDGAYKLAEKVRTSIAETSFILDDSLRPTRITVSIGVAQFHGDRKEFFQNADSALYRAKAMGKNCVVLDDGTSASASA